MVKGINKQIIEIKCTNNEYFDKILLFVSAEKADALRDISFLEGEAKKVCEELTFQKQGSARGRLTMVLGAAAAVSAAVFGLVMICFFI